MSQEHELRTVTNTIAAAALHFNMTGRKPADLYAHLADALVSAQLVQSPESAAELERLRARVSELESERAKYIGAEPTIAEEMAYLSQCVDTVHDVCNDAERQATRWESPLPVPEWVAKVRSAADGLERRRSYPPAMPWARLMDADDLEGLLAELADAASGDDDLATLDEVEAAIARWRAIAEAQHAHNTAPGPDAEKSPDRLTATYAPVAALREDPHDSPLHHDYQLGRDLPQTGGAR